MVQSCCAINCKVRRNKGVKLKLLSIPKDSVRRNQWLVAIRRKNFNPSDKTVICENHFTEDDFELNVHGNRVLKKTSVPSVFNFPVHPKEKLVARSPLKQKIAETDHLNTTDDGTSGTNTEVVLEVFSNDPVDEYMDVDNEQTSDQTSSASPQKEFSKRFPSNYMQKKKWVESINEKQNYILSDTSLVCEKQFTQFDHIKNIHDTIDLSKNAGPSLFGEEKELSNGERKFQDNSSSRNTNDSPKDMSSNNDRYIFSKASSMLPSTLNSDPVIKNIRKDNFLEICRCCVVNMGEINVFEAHFHNLSFAELIYFCTNEQILVTDDMPKSVCKICTQQIISSFAFVKKVKDMQLHIREFQKIFSVESQEQCNKTDFDSTSNQNNVIMENINNYRCENKHSNALNFKQKYYGLTGIYRQLCNVILENRKQLKKPIKTKRNIHTSLKESVTKEMSEGQQLNINTPAAYVEESQIKISSVPRNNKYVLSESYRKAVDDSIVNCEVYTVPDEELNENLEGIMQSSYHDIRINNIENFSEKQNDVKEKTKKVTCSIRCFECPEVFQTESGLILHCRSTGHAMTDRFRCKFCSSTFRLRKVYRRHLKSHNKTRCICEICGAEVFSTTLKKHMEVHADVKYHVCPFCSNTYIRKVGLDDHIKHKHFGVYNSLCFICGKSIKNSEKMNIHLNNYHVDDDLSNKCYQCEKCKKYFISEVSLSFHRKYSHAEDLMNRQRFNKRRKILKAKEKHSKIKQLFVSKPYESEHISNGLQSSCSSGYKSHIHQEIKPYNCKICDKQFRQYWHLKSHMNFHLNRKSYKC